jgi:hypothetical protein
MRASFLTLLWHLEDRSIYKSFSEACPALAALRCIMRGGYGQANNFPKTAESLPTWLDAIQLVRGLGSIRLPPLLPPSHPERSDEGGSHHKLGPNSPARTMFARSCPCDLLVVRAASI